jgi:hypothetical protein
MLKKKVREWTHEGGKHEAERMEAGGSSFSCWSLVQERKRRRIGVREAEGK